MKDLELGKDYVLPSPGYRGVSCRDAQQPKDCSKYHLPKVQRPLCQDALETAARAEGLPLDTMTLPHLKELEEDRHRSKYHHSLSLLKPIRSTNKHQHPVDNAGLFSFMTFNWLTPLASKAHKKGQLFMDDIWALSKWESSEHNSRRLAALWQVELKSRGDEASLHAVAWSFCRTRLLLSIVCLMITQLAGFSGPVSNTIPISPLTVLTLPPGGSPLQERQGEG